MAGFVMLNAKVLVGGYNFSGQHNSLSLEHGAEMLDETVFQPGVTGATRKFKPGLKTFQFSGNVFWDTSTDEVMFNRVGADRAVMHFAPVGETEGDIVFMTRGVTATYNPASGAVGDLLQATVDGRNSNTPLVRAQLMKFGTVVATGNSTGIQMGSAANKIVYSGLQILAPTVAGGGGEQVIVTIESDDNAGFTTPTTRLTHSTMTVRGANWQEAAIGAGVTDDYWRAKWTISGSSPSFSIYVSVGIM